MQKKTGRTSKSKAAVPTRTQVNKARKSILNWLGQSGWGAGDQWSFAPGPSTPLTQLSTLWINNRWYLLSNLRQLLSESYVEHGLIQTLVDVPVDDAMRGGVQISSKQIEQDQVIELNNWMERQGDLLTYGQSEKWKRLFGGAGIVIMNGQDPTTPLDFKSMKEGDPIEFRDVDMWELYWSTMDSSNYAESIDGQEWISPTFYDYYGQKLHNTRVLKLIGLKAPSFVRPRLRGWGFSVVEILINELNQYLKSNNLVFEVLDEFKVDYYKIKNLANAVLSADGGAAVRDRLSDMNRSKNYQRAVAMDSEDDWNQKQLSFAGIAETMQGIRMGIASAMRMPLTKVFGISAAGFSSGEDDIENYNSMIESTIRERARFHLIRMIELRCIQLFGYAPDDISLEFKPLRVLGAEAEQNVKTQIFSRALQTVQAGLCTVEDFKNACNKDNLLPIQLDPSIDRLEVAQTTAGGMDGGEKVGTTKSTEGAPEAKT